MPRLLVDRYELGPVIGEGGMGVVHRGHDRVLDRPVAIKIVPNEPRFLDEARRTAGIRHPSIVEVHDVGEDAADAFLVMELLEGETLEERVARAGPLAAADAIDVGVRVCEALGAAHALGVVHRDIKPANVFLLADGRVKVLDFGIARRTVDVTRQTESGSLVGTLTYMAPEQIRGEKVDGRTDLYGLGGTLYAAITGAPPFDDANAATLIHATLDRRPASLCERVPAVPAAVDAAVLRLLEKEPRHRPADAAAARTLLLDARAGRGPTTTREIELDPAASAASFELAVLPAPRPTTPAPIVVHAFQPLAPAPEDPPSHPVLATLATVPASVSKRIAAYAVLAIVLDVVFFSASAVVIAPLAILAALGSVAYFSRRRP